MPDLFWVLLSKAHKLERQQTHGPQAILTAGRESEAAEGRSDNSVGTLAKTGAATRAA